MWQVHKHSTIGKKKIDLLALNYLPKECILQPHKHFIKRVPPFMTLSWISSLLKFYVERTVCTITSKKTVKGHLHNLAKLYCWMEAKIFKHHPSGASMRPMGVHSSCWSGWRLTPCSRRALRMVQTLARFLNPFSTYLAASAYIGSRDRPSTLSCPAGSTSPTAVAALALPDTAILKPFFFFPGTDSRSHHFSTSQTL